MVAREDRLQIEKLVLGPFETNAYIVTCRETQWSVIVDAPAEPDRILEKLQGTQPKAILMTHSHMDHVGALGRLRSVLKVPVAAYGEDDPPLTEGPDRLLKDGEMFAVGALELRVLHTPGHTPGSLCFVVGRHLLSGDTLFPNGPGKTGSPEDFRRIVESITKKLFSLPDDTEVHPGHGTSTVLGREKQAYQGFASRSHPPGLCGDVLWSSQ
jgi:glyoxylase-like metal-dependent hydrolase (beta-lactamase superfamily II)